MTAAEFLNGLSDEKLAYAENLIGQRDESLARIAAMDAELASLKMKHDEAVQTKISEIDALKAEKTELAATVDALGGTELGQQLHKQKEIERLTAEAAEFEKRKLAALDRAAELAESK